MTQKHSAFELAFRRGVVNALSIAADLVRSGASADDLDALAAAPARAGSLPDVYMLESQ